MFLWRTSRPHMAIVGQVPGTEHFRNVDRHDVITDPAILSIRVDESLYFANARALEDAIYDRIADHPALKNVILMCPAVNAIDASALESLEAIAHRLGSAGIGFHLSEVKGPVMDALKRSDFMDHFKGRIFMSHFEAVRSLSVETTAAATPIGSRIMPRDTGSTAQLSLVPLPEAGHAG
jgi:SulP family sulfate permease